MGTKLVFCFLAAALLSRGQSTATATANPSGVTFNYQIGGQLPSPQTVSVRTSTGTPAYTATVSPGTAPWLVVSPDTGKMPASLSIRVNPTSMAVGSYTATVNVAIAGIGSPTAITVTLNVSSPLPTLTLSATSLNFTSPPTPAAQTVTLSTTGTPITFTASASGAAWVSVSPSTGVVLPGEQFTVSVSVDPTGLNPQSKPYTGKVTIVANGVASANKTQNISVGLTVNSPVPAVASIWPATLQTNTGPSTITIRGTNFYSASIAKAGATALVTTVISSTVLNAIVPATLLTASGTLNIIVSNPAPGGDSTPAVPLTVSNAPVIQAILNAASYASGTVGLGEIVTMFGAGIGPAAPVYMTDANSDGIVDSTIGGFAVTIDGQPAPILYADPNQVTVQVPYEATIGSGKAVSVANGGPAPATSTVTVAATAPGIFTADGSGTGQAAAIVYPAAGGAAALNSSSVPARAGDTVVLYVTGEGDYVTTPVAHTGYIVPAATTTPPSMPTAPNVSIGGAAATVTYAGSIPGSMLGLLQINATVPAGATTGNSVPVTVTISGVASQSNVTLVVK